MNRPTHHRGRAAAPMRIAVALLLGAAAGCGRATPPPPPPAAHPAEPGARSVSAVALPAPEVSIALLDSGRAWPAGADGRVLVVHFWATWCRPCLRDRPVLEALRVRVGPDRLEILDVSLSEPDTAAVKRFDREHPVPYPVGLDADAALADAMGGVYTLPTTFVIDPAGVVRRRVTGVVTTEILSEIVDGFLPRPGG